MNTTDILTGLSGWSLILRSKPSVQIELRKTFGEGDMLLIVSNGGYTYKFYKPSSEKGYGRHTDDYNLHISSNGPLQMDWNDFVELELVVARCKKVLKKDFI